MKTKITKSTERTPGDEGIEAAQRDARAIKSEKALNAFIRKSKEATELLERLTEAAENHFGADPETLDWGHVGNVTEVVAQLKRAIRFAGCATAAELEDGQ